jgi:hypothetical protein
MVVFCCTELVFELPVTLRNEEYADMHFEYGVCDDSGRVAIEKHQ